MVRKKSICCVALQLRRCGTCVGASGRSPENGRPAGRPYNRFCASCMVGHAARAQDRARSIAPLSTSTIVFADFLRVHQERWSRNNGLRCEAKDARVKKGGFSRGGELLSYSRDGRKEKNQGMRKSGQPAQISAGTSPSPGRQILKLFYSF